jgi:hypothetical protein
MHVWFRYKIFPFKFSGTVLADMRDQHTNSSSAGFPPEASGDKRGTIEIKISEAYEDLNAAPRIFTPVAKGMPGGEAAIDKDKKFWTQPSATVGCDETKSTVAKTGAPDRPWVRRTTQACSSSMVYYHTPNVIKILKMMRPKAEGAEAEDEEEEDESFVDAVPKTKTNVKKESSSSSSSSRKPKMPLESAGPITISLVDDLVPAPAKKKAKQPSTTPIVIDLT